MASRPCKLEKVLYAEGLGEAIRGLLSWRPDLASCPGPSGCSLLAPLPSSYFKASLFSRDTCFFFHKTQSPSQLPHPIPCSPKVPTLVTGMDGLFSNLNISGRISGMCLSHPLYRVTKQDTRSHCSHGYRQPISDPGQRPDTALGEKSRQAGAMNTAVGHALGP